MHAPATPAPATAKVPFAERKIVLLLASVQFINVLDFMMVMPLGPDFAEALGIPLSRLGLVGGAYTAAAAVAGLASSTFLDRFDRRNALAVALVGLAAGTLCGAFAQGFGTLLLARVVAGAFGGPATAIALAILADVVPAERRGKAMGAVMGAFAAASVLGVPAGLELAHRGGWRMPFFAVSALGILVTVVAVAVMPPLRSHLGRSDGQPRRPLSQFLGDRLVQLSLCATGVAFVGTFALVPNLASYFQFNLGYPRERLGALYMVGGVVAFIAMRIGGAMVDKGGPNVVTVAGSLLMVGILSFGYLPANPVLPVMALFVILMLSNAIRSVALNTVSSKVPSPAERGRFMASQSAVQHITAAIGATASSLLLVEGADHKLQGMSTLVVMSILLALVLPIVVWNIDKGLRARGVASFPPR